MANKAIYRVPGLVVQDDQQKTTKALAGYFSGKLTMRGKAQKLYDYVARRVLAELEMKIVDFFVWKWRGRFYPEEKLLLPDGDLLGWESGEQGLEFEPGELSSAPVVYLVFSRIDYFYEDAGEFRTRFVWTLQDTFGDYNLVLGRWDGKWLDYTHGTKHYQWLFRPVRDFPWSRKRRDYDISIGPAVEFSEHEIEVSENNG